MAVAVHGAHRSTATLGPLAGAEHSATPLDHPVDGARLAAGTMLGRYVVTEYLGAGGMGVVYGAYDPSLDRHVAVKLLHPDCSSAHRHARMMREAQAMARLSHPNAVHIYDVGVHEGRGFIAMELVRGPTLRRKLETALPWREVIGAYVQAARGLAAAHAAGLVHRDFKPDNVLCGEDGRVRVADFGLVELDAPAVRETACVRFQGSDVETAAGDVLGTPGYIAPEALRREPVDARADQFSYCVALFEALFGVHPYAAVTPEERINRIARGDLARPARVAPVPRRICDLLARGLRFRPEDRHPSMTILADALERAAHRRWRWPVLALAGALGVLSVALAMVSI